VESNKSEEAETISEKRQDSSAEQTVSHSGAAAGNADSENASV